MQCYIDQRNPEGSTCPKTKAVFYLSFFRMVAMSILGGICLVVTMCSVKAYAFAMREEHEKVPHLDLTKGGVQVLDMTGAELPEDDNRRNKDDKEDVGLEESYEVFANYEKVQRTATPFERVKDAAKTFMGWQAPPVTQNTDTASQDAADKRARDAPVTEGTGVGRLSLDAYEQFSGSFAPLGGGYSSGRTPFQAADAPSTVASSSTKPDAKDNEQASS